MNKDDDKIVFELYKRDAAEENDFFVILKGSLNFSRFNRDLEQIGLRIGDGILNYTYCLIADVKNECTLIYDEKGNELVCVFNILHGLIKIKYR